MSFADDWRSAGEVEVSISGSPASPFCSDLSRAGYVAVLGGDTPNLALRYSVRYHRPANATTE